MHTQTMSQPLNRSSELAPPVKNWQISLDGSFTTCVNVIQIPDPW